MKICNACKIEKDNDSFYKDKRDKNKLQNKCVVCCKSYYSENKKRIEVYKKEYYQKNKEKIKAKKNQHYKNNRKSIIKKQKLYIEKNRVKVNLYYKTKKLEDINFKLKHILRSRLLQALKNNYKSGSAVKDLGCSIEQLKCYLENKFEAGMTWENHGKWHIDHIKPLASFDLEDREQLLQACHFTNLQPLWAEENLRKNKF
jgi:hypothetical protein